MIVLFQMSHRRVVTESELEWSLKVITDEYVASTYTMDEEEYLLETVEPCKQKLTPHQVVRLIDHSNIKEAVWDDAAVRRSFRRMAKVMRPVRRNWSMHFRKRSRGLVWKRDWPNARRKLEEKSIVRKLEWQN